MNTEDEAIQTAKIAEFIKCIYEGRDLDAFSGPGSGTEEGRRAIRDSFVQERLRTKERICQQCYEDYRKKDEYWLEMEMSDNEGYSTFFQDWHEEEMQRMNKPIESCTSDVESYIVPLPDRSRMLQNEFGYDVHNKNDREQLLEFQFYLDQDIGSIFAVKPCSRQQMRITRFMRDRFPNEQEITSYLQRRYSSPDYFTIQYCKVFELGVDNRNRPKFTIVVHFSRPKGYWLKYEINDDILTRPHHTLFIPGCIKSPLYLDADDWTEMEYEDLIKRKGFERGYVKLTL